jgi:hypothetical protein
VILDISAKEYFAKLDGDRSSTLDRAEKMAKVTIPYLFMEEGTSGQDDLTTGYTQGFGAKLVNHLTGKFALSILPPSQSFYRLSAGNEAMEKVTGGDRKYEQEVEKILAQIEDGIMRYINNTRFRKSLYPALRLAMVTGECIVEKVEDNVYKIHNLRKYVIKRDSSGNILHLVIQELLDADALPDGIDVEEENEEQEVELYTHFYLEDGVYNMYQEVEGNKFNEGTLKKFTDKFINVRWNVVDGEDYARSFCEEHYETFVNLEKQMKVLVSNAIVSSKTVFTVNPNGMTRLKDYVDAKNGDAIVGNETDIGTVKVNKHIDLQSTYQLVTDLKRELAETFLMSSAGIRNAERVTAQEVQLVASELEASFGGIYTAIASDIQMPLVENAISSLNIEGMEDIDIIITSGVEALGRTVEQQKVRNMIQDLGGLAQLIGTESIIQNLNPEALISSIINNSGVGNKNFMKDLVTKEAEAKAQQEQQLAQQALQPALQEAGKGMGQQLTQQGGME